MIYKKVSTILLYNENSKILLQLRTHNAPTYPSFWCFFGGKIEKNETPLEAIIRETKEELEYTLEDPKKILFTNVYNIEHDEDVEAHIFIEKYNSTKKLVLHEGEKMQWFTLEEIQELKMIPNMKKIVEELKEVITLQMS